MENLGLNKDVSVGRRTFHVETNFLNSAGLIVSNTFLDGQVIDSKEVSVRAGLPDQEVGALLNEVHQQTITDMEILYYIDEKVKTVRHASSANKLGLLFLQKNLYRESIEQFNLALEIDPGLSEVLANLGKALLMTDSLDEAIEVLERGTQQAPQYADIQNYLGIAYLYKEDFDPAVLHLQEAISLNSNYIGAYYHLGMALLAKSVTRTGTPQPGSEETRQRAIDYLAKAAERMVNRQIANFDAVMTKVDNQAYEDAVNEFLLSKPKEVLTHFLDIENEFYLKFMYGGKGKDDAFIAEYVNKLRELIAKHPAYADIHNNMGIANLIQCRNLFLKALEEFRAALKINPRFKKAEKNLKLAENDGKGFLILLRAILK
ncbi:MAG: tetratricopeptide repeat protein [bacterium]